ncbi:AAA family ATPase [Solitalea canadensis]|uniref:MoxR-like ATPase n=1 Tax=Solitalea canadensis (strain ATCC 29591 / DSM 3403 / JCM 21819 / LMG 8368 / NBRC 15130 / NCIMB 12057 / USAM 9D) TaxID=929556 RepID=H8KLR5_SOLCM|nr:MoxR family ATPase [Solitalea canadensis]AFD09219.1 MoxR-like ATPase [Solitalea canadensis DSM 3403]
MEETTFQNRIDFEQLNQSVSKIKEELAKVIVGQEKFIELLITAIFADGHVLIEGVPGVAKTLTAKLMAKTIKSNFSRIQFTPDLMPSDVLGTSVFNPSASNFEFKQGPIFSNIILIDEINRSPAKTQAALFEVMEERQVTNDGITYPMAFPFLVMATQNPIDQEGTYRLPEAQLDRFIFKIEVKYPSLAEEILILNGHHTGFANKLDEISSVLDSNTIAFLREKIRQVHVEPKLIEYIAQIVNSTRDNKFLYLGASPRASVAILNASKALAAIRGRDFVTPEDIQELAYPVLRHRIILSPEKEMEGATADDIIKLIVQKLEVPR